MDHSGSAPGWYAKSLSRAALTAEQLEAYRRASGTDLYTAQALCTARAIARLDPRIGELIDELGCSLAVAKHIAHAKGAPAQAARAETSFDERIAKLTAKGERPPPAVIAMVDLVFGRPTSRPPAGHGGMSRLASAERHRCRAPGEGRPCARVTIAPAALAAAAA